MTGYTVARNVIHVSTCLAAFNLFKPLEFSNVLQEQVGLPDSSLLLYSRSLLILYPHEQK
jgi:hypothetical protein